jgi:hypothetical protein
MKFQRTSCCSHISKSNRHVSQANIHRVQELIVEERRVTVRRNAVHLGARKTRPGKLSQVIVLYDCMPVHGRFCDDSIGNDEVGNR